MAGAIIGWASRRISSVGTAVVVGGVISLFFAGLIVLMNKMSGLPPYYLEIMIPGALVGVIVGYATFRYGDRPKTA